MMNDVGRHQMTQNRYNDTDEARYLELVQRVAEVRAEELEAAKERQRGHMGFRPNQER